MYCIYYNILYLHCQVERNILLEKSVSTCQLSGAAALLSLSRGSKQGVRVI
jgi:hypothetical protein